MKIGITGATGLIGGRVRELAVERGHETVSFTRSPESVPAANGEARKFSTAEPLDLGGLDAIVHLAGESILGLWTPPKKRRILKSRVAGTCAIVDALRGAANGPSIFVCGSAIGFYGDTGESVATEASPAGTGFLAEVAEAWEAEATRADGVRTTIVRTGFVLARDAGAMALVTPVFRAGLGGKLGSGQQWMSCVHVDDVAGLILHAVENSEVSGPLNAVLPEPVRNLDFTRAVAAAVHRPAILPAPEIALKIALGQLSHLLLDSQRVVPERTVASGYTFHYANLASALDATVG